MCEPCRISLHPGRSRMQSGFDVVQIQHSTCTNLRELSKIRCAPEVFDDAQFVWPVLKGRVDRARTRKTGLPAEARRAPLAQRSAARARPDCVHFRAA